MVGERLWTDGRDGTLWAVTFRQLGAETKSGADSYALTFLAGDGTSFNVVVPAAVTSGLDALSDAEFRGWLAEARRLAQRLN